MSGFENFLNDIAARFTGPLGFRFILQPLIAILLGMRDGRLDTKAGAPPYIIHFLFYPERRRELLANASATILKPIAVGIVLDAVAQYLIFETIRPLQAVLVGSLVLGLPYALARGLTNRIVSRKKRL